MRPNLTIKISEPCLKAKIPYYKNTNSYEGVMYKIKRTGKLISSCGLCYMYEEINQFLNQLYTIHFQKTFK